MPAPNETLEQEARKNELFAIRETRQLTLEELNELRELTAIACSHLVFTRFTGNAKTKSRKGA